MNDNSRTLFVRNIPKASTNEELESHFSEYGPIKRCFIILDKETKESRGFGYVSFVTREDAVSALKDTHKFNGINLNIGFSDSRENNAKNDKSSQEKKPKTKKPKPTTIAKKTGVATLASNTVVISPLKKNLTLDKIVESLKSKLKKLPPYEELEYPANGDRKDTLFIRFDSKYIANNAMLMLRKWKDPEVSTAKLNVIRRSQEVILMKQHKQNRLIIRNLSYKCTELQLRGAFTKFGALSEVVIPKNKKGGKKIGCAFVQFLRQNEAKNALSSLNGSKILDRVVAIDWAVSKNKFTEEPKTDAKVKQEVKQEPDSKPATASGSSSEDEDEDEEGGMVFEKLDSEKAQDEAKKSGQSSDNESDSDIEMSFEPLGKDKNESDDDNEEMESDDDSDGHGEDSDGENSDYEDSDNEDSDGESKSNKKKKDLNSNKKNSDTNVTKVKKASDVGEGKTLFIRNLPFNASEEDIGDIFRKYGVVSYCKIVKDKQNNLSKGCAFVKFDQKEECEEVFRIANFTQAHYGAGIQFEGRKLVVSSAMTPEAIGDLKEKSGEKKVKDLRNLGLAREGLIRGGTQAAQGLSQQDLDRRNKLETTKRQKLKDLNTFVSTTRLSVHNLPTRIDDAELKQIFYSLLKKAGKDAGNTVGSGEQVDEEEQEREEDEDTTAVDSDMKAEVVDDFSDVFISECRVMRDMKSVNSDGQAKSRGFAFLNFQEHKHALAALRLSNNNPDIFGDKKRPIVEFSLENKSALQLKERRMQRSQLKKDQRQQSQQGGKWKRPSKDELSSSTIKYNGVKPSISQPAPTFRKINKDGKQLSLKQQSKRQKKVNTGLSSHWGAKVRHVARPAQSEKQKNKKQNSRKRAFDNEDKKVQGKRKNNNNSKKHKTDNFDKMVSHYSQKFSSAAANSNKWYD